MSTLLPDSHRDIAESLTLASIAYRLPSGLLANHPVSFLWDGEQFYFSTLKAYHKYRHLQLNPELTMLIVDANDPRRYLELRGQAVLSPDKDTPCIDRIAKKYFNLDHYPYDRPDDERVTATLQLEQLRAVEISH